jgi:hypothetical protein
MTNMAVQTPMLIPWWSANTWFTNLSGRLLAADIAHAGKICLMGRSDNLV